MNEQREQDVQEAIKLARTLLEANKNRDKFPRPNVTSVDSYFKAIKSSDARGAARIAHKKFIG
jgi:hypothetical protein